MGELRSAAGGVEVEPHAELIRTFMLQAHRAVMEQDGSHMTEDGAMGVGAGSYAIREACRDAGY